MMIKILILICTLGITAYTIEWKAWNNHKLRNAGLSIFLVFAFVFGVKDITEQTKKDNQAKKDNAYLRHSVNYTNKELLAARKDIKTAEDSLSKVLRVLERNKINFEFRTDTIHFDIGFYERFPDPGVNQKIKIALAQKQLEEKELVNKQAQEAVKNIKTPVLQKPKVDETVRKVKLEGYLRDYDGEKTEYIVDSTNRSKYSPTDPLYKQMTGYMESDRKLMKRYQDSLRKYK